MLNILAAVQPDAPLMQLASAVGALGVALSVAGFAGVFNRGSVSGPARFEPGERVGPVCMIMLIGLASWLMVQPLFASLWIHASGTLASTTPSTQPSLSPTDAVAVGLVSLSVLLMVLVITHSLMRPRGLRGLGFSVRSLPKALIAGVISIAIVLPLMFVATLATQHIFELFGWKNDAHPLLRALKDEGGTGLRFMVVLSAVVLAPLAEELLFRGHMQTAIAYALAQRNKSSVIELDARARWGAIILTSFAFALVHPALWMMPLIFLLAICLGYAYERTGNLWVPILIHAAFNTINLLNFWSELANR